MRIATRTVVGMGCVLAVAAIVSVASAATVVSWLDMSPTAYGSAVPNNSVINVPGVGNVTITYSIPANVTHVRQAGGAFVAGNIGTTSWTNYEAFSTIFTDGPDPLVPVTWSITYTFPSTLPAGTVYFGSIGLGQTSSFGGGASVFTVNQNSTFLGDWTDGGPWGPTQYTGGFSVQNSLTGSGGQNPWWNTPLGVVRIDDAVSSLTVNCSQIRGDGIAENIGFAVEPTPARSTSWGRMKNLYR
ncbi:MAG TPA: hypothetical protein VJY35_00445 [Candidatus Eisenbacteria bacterium]|nr:hypothetical protein [Candidatus Eisenbacteria bacterium]